jgi:homoserine kinase
MPEVWRTVRVPGSSANLGPGFDALGLALSVYLEVRFRPSAKLAIRAAGLDAARISIGEDNLIWQTARDVAGTKLGHLEIEIDNQIPVGKGLGSSAAALVAGVVIASETAGLNWPRARVLEEAARIEGHPDNVSACCLGSLVASALDSDGRVRFVRLDVDPRIEAAVVVPDYELPTAEARRVLPGTYSRADAIFNAQRSALLVAALATGALDAFPMALEDRVHQPYRSALIPGLDEIVKLEAPGLLGCALSGAGPSILVFFERGRREVCQRVCDVFAARGHAAQVLDARIAADGYKNT